MCHGCVDHELYLCCVVLVLYLCCPSQWSVFLHVEDLLVSCWTCWLWVLVHHEKRGSFPEVFQTSGAL